MAEPLSKFPILDTSDLEKAEAEISEKLADSRLLHVADPSAFHVKMNAVKLGESSIVFNRFSSEAIVETKLQDDVLHFVFGNGPPTTFVSTSGSATTRAGTCITLPPGRRLEIHRPAKSEVLVVNATKAGLARRLERLTGQPQREAPEFSERIDASHGVGAAVARRLRFALDEVEVDDRAISNPVLRQSLDEMVLSALLALPHSKSEVLAHRLHHKSEPGPVVKAEAYLRAHLAEPITIPDLLRAAGCGRTILFAAFRTRHGCTPMEFLTGLRLDRAREMLHAASATDTVSSVAMALGFAHLGRFSSKYKSRFGELPSKTLSRRDQAG